MTLVTLCALVLAGTRTVTEDADPDNMMLELRGDQFIFSCFTHLFLVRSKSQKEDKGFRRVFGQCF